MLAVMLSGCGVDKAVGTGESEMESQIENETESEMESEEDGIQGNDILDNISDGQTERVEDSDGGWIIIEYDAAGQEVKRTHYNAEGNLMQIEELDEENTAGKAWKITDYNLAGKRVLSTVYNANGNIISSTEYDENEEQKIIIIYVYDSTGKVKYTTERNLAEQLDKSITYKYNADGTVNYYCADFEYDHGKCVKYISYNADGVILSVSEFNSDGLIVKYTSYYYSYYHNEMQVAGYTVTEYDNNGEIVGTTRYETEPQSSDVNLTQQKESDHFVFYCSEPDIEVLDALEETLEGCYDRVTSDLGGEPSSKTKVYVSPNLKAYHNAIGRPNDPDWSVGQVPQDGNIYMVSPLNPGPQHTYDDMFVNAVHEFVHVVTKSFDGKLPSVLSEGIATYVAGQNNSCLYHVQKDREEGTLPSLTEIARWNSYVNMSSYDSNRAYAYGYVYISFVVETSGFDTVISLLEGKSQTEAFGLSEEELSEKWMDFLESYEK